MIRDWTDTPNTFTRPDVTHVDEAYGSDVKGFSIHQVQTAGEPDMYELYTDDGRGNGDHICTSSDLYWIRRIAVGLDRQYAKDFDHTGWERVS